MRLAVLALVALATSAVAQPSAAYWIIAETSAVPAEGSPHALERRAQRGSGPVVARAITPAVRDGLRALGVVPRVESRWLGAVSAVLDDGQRAAVAALPGVREVRPVGRLVPTSAVHADAIPEATASTAPTSLVLVPDFGPSAGQLQIVGADETLAAGYTGAGVRVGFLDTLYDFSHPALVRIQTDGRLVAVRDFTGQSQNDYHGLATTSVAFGYADGRLVGPAYDAEVVAATTEFAPTETRAEEDSFVAGLEWLEANGADVVSVSLGYFDFDGPDDYTYADLDGDTSVLTRAVDRAAALGVAVVVAAGNEGNGAWRYITVPADADSAITVGGVTPSGTHAAYSGYGPTADGRIKPDVAAQASGVYFATRGGYASGNGTSFATPMVAGIVAQLLQANPALTPIGVRDLLRQTASQAAAPDTVLGWGIVDAGAALDLALATSADAGPEAPGWRLAPSVMRASGRLTIETPESAPLAIYDAVGRRVARIEAAAGRRAVAVPPLPTGLYFVRPEGERPLPAQRLVIVR